MIYVNYTILDLIEKLRSIEEDAYELYKEIEENFKTGYPKISIVAKTIAKFEKSHIKYYEKLYDELKDKNNEQIDFFLYDKAAKLLYEFKTHIEKPQVNDVKGLIKYAMEFEKNSTALLLDIQGRLFLKKEDTDTELYETITKIIKEEQEHERMFEKLITAIK